jgi:hypothetical protein
MSKTSNKIINEEIEMNKIKDIKLIFITECENCGEDYVSRKRSWYSEDEIYLCEECFISILSIEECRGTVKRLCENKDCKKCYLKSFVVNEKSEYWSENNELTPRQVFLNSHKKCLFNCAECGHEFVNDPQHINGHNRWCSYCANKKLCDNYNCIPCFNKSFASHERSRYWSVKNNVSPRQVFLNTRAKYLFNCGECKHEFESTLIGINTTDKWCLYCSNTILCDDNNCKSCFKKSFASHERSRYWSVKNNISPRQVFLNTHIKYLFNCGECKHEFVSDPNGINISNKWCPICVNKTEKCILEFILPVHSSIIHQYKPDWCRNMKTNRCLPFDFFIPELKIIIEIDGRQHFEYVSRFKNNVTDNQDRDIYKSLLALQNGISIIRIVQDDVWKNKIDWKKLLIDEIERLKLLSEPIISYISKDNEIYREHISKIEIEEDLQKYNDIEFEEE